MIKKKYFALMTAIGILAVAAITAAGCSMFKRPAKPVSNWTIAEARAFDEFQLYWVGRQYEGLPLTFVGRSVDADEVTHITFAYGEPSYFGDAASGSWLSPLEIDIQPYCGLLRHDGVSDDFGIKLKSHPDIRIDGAVGRVSRYDFWNYVFLLSGDSFMDISTNRHADFDIEQAAGDMVAIAEESAAPRQPLPAPNTTEC